MENVSTTPVKIYSYQSSNHLYVFKQKKDNQWYLRIFCPLESCFVKIAKPIELDSNVEEALAPKALPKLLKRLVEEKVLPEEWSPTNHEPLLITLTQKIDGVEDCLKKNFDPEKAEKLVKELEEEGRRLIRREVLDQGEETLLTPVAIKAVEILGMDRIQFCDTLKCSLAKVARIFLELLLFRAVINQRNVYSKTRKDLVTKLDTIIATLPEKEVVTKFEATCALQAARALDDEGFIRNYSEAALKAATKVSLSKIVGLLLKITNVEQPIAQWYPESSEIRWLLTNVETLKELKNCEKELDTLLEKGPEGVFCFAEILISILENQEAEPDLQKEALNKLFNLLNSKREDGYWETRYRAITYFGEALTKHPIHNFQSCIYIIDQLQAEHHPCITEYIHTLLKSHVFQENCIKAHLFYEDPQDKNEKLIQENQTKKVESLLNETLEKLVVNETDLEDKKKKIDQMIGEIHSKQEDLAKRITAASPSQQSGNNVGKAKSLKDDMEKLKAKRKQLEEEQKNLIHQQSQIPEAKEAIEIFKRNILTLLKEQNGSTYLIQ